jgi:bifunctional DNA-binding transcriptional regulator/antitoxin component of YhaV-PrlF toxin-antitoxin module
MLKMIPETDMSKRYVLEVDVDDHGECFLTLPDEMLNEMGWSEGTLLEWSEDEYGTVMLKAAEEE